jgi:anti-anti-sigma factor
MAEYDDFQVTRHGDLTVIQLDGLFLDRAVIFEWSDALAEFLEKEKPGKLLMSFEQVKRFSSEAIGVVIRANRRVQAYSGQLKLCGLDPVIRDMFRTANLDGTVFEIFDSCGQARDSFG